MNFASMSLFIAPSPMHRGVWNALALEQLTLAGPARPVDGLESVLAPAGSGPAQACWVAALATGGSLAEAADGAASVRGVRRLQALPARPAREEDAASISYEIVWRADLPGAAPGSTPSRLLPWQQSSGAAVWLDSCRLQLEKRGEVASLLQVAQQVSSMLIYCHY